MDMSSSANCNIIASLQDENIQLQHELNKVEDLLACARADRDEILIKYNALNEKVTIFHLKKVVLVVKEKSHYEIRRVCPLVLIYISYSARYDI